MIGRTTESAFQDARAVSLTQGELEKNNRIKTYFQKDDKIPNIDGYFETLGSAGLPLKRFAVQIKGKDKLEYRKTLKKYSYSADSGFFQYMLEGIESNPGMFFVAERNTGRVFFKYVSGEFLEELVRKGLLSRGSFTIRFDEEDILDEKRFYSLCEEIRNGGKLPFDPDSIIPADIDFKSIRKLSEGLWVNWKTGRLDCDVTAALLEERRDRNVTAALPEERRDCGRFPYREQAGKLPVMLSKASLRLLSVLVQGEGAVVCWEELYRRGIVMHETIGKIRRASDQVLREGSGEAYAEPDREDFAEMAAAGGSAHPTGVEMAAGGSAYPIGGETAAGGSAYPTVGEMATGSAHPTGEEPEAVGGAYPKDGETENAGSVYPSDEEAEHILEGALKTVDGEEAGDSLKQKVTAVIAAVRELCAQAPALTEIVRPAKNGKGFRIILKETGIRSMRGYFPEADGTDAANAEWDTLTKNIENGYCDTKGWLRRHYAAVCASFEGKISNAGGNIKKESKVFGNYTMAEAYSHAYAQSARANTAEPMLDFVEQWYRGIRAQMSAQRMTHSDENALNRVLVLHGNPGDGKTTFCKKAVYAHCLEGWLADVPHVVRVSLNRNENRGILKEKSLNLANALGIFMRPTNQFLFCAPHKLGEGSVVILDGYDELVGDLAGDVNVSTFAEFCDRVREQADICKWFVIITSRTMCIRRELDEKKDDFETGTVASFAPMTVARQDLMIDRMIELDEARRQNSGPGRTPGGSNDVTDLRTYQEGELKKLRNEKRIRKFLEIPILFRMIVTTRFKAGEGTATEAGLYGRLFHNLMQYRDRTRVNEATLIADYENIAARIFNYNNDICPFGSGDDENKELIYLFLTKNEEEKGDEPEEGTDGQKKRGAKKRGGRRKEGRLGFLHGSFRQYFLARYLVSGIRKSCAEGGKEEFLDFFRNLRARPIYEHLVWTFVYELVRIGGTEQDPFRDTMPNEVAEPDWPLTMKEIKAVRKFLDDEMAFADWMAGDAAYEQGPDAQKQRWLMAENAVFNLVSALAAAERACREEGEEADGYRNYTNLAGLLRRGYWGSDVGIYLEGAELAGCNLYRANLANAYLAGACLKGASLRSANLKGAELEGADLRDTAFEGADLFGAVIRNAFFRGANFAGANLTDAILEDASPDGPDAGEDGNGEKGAKAGRENTVFKGANLTGAKMKGIHLENADLQGVNLANADLSDAILKSAILTGADLANADLTDAILQGAILTGADLANADLSGTILEGADLTGANLKGADFSGTILTGAHLDGADLREVWLIGADLTGAHLMDAYLDRAVLKDAILTDAHLERTHLEGAELSGADFKKAHLEGANLKAAYLDALIPGQTAVTNGDLSGCSDLTGAYLSGADLHGAYISDSQFQYARKRGATGRPFTAPGEKLRSYPGRIRDVLKVAGKGSRQAAELVSGMGQIAFGRYKQGRNGEMLPLRWRVLKTDVEKNRVLLITEKLIDCRAYHNEYAYITWKKCDLRKWLNKEFLQEAFTRDERERIAVTDNANPDNAKYKTPGGSSTDDRIFLLSMDEAGECFRDDRDRRADVTPYAKGQYRRSDFYSLFGDQGMGWWWLRSPGFDGRTAADISYGVGVFEIGHHVCDSALSVRPALWLNL